jgi:tRNA 2-thiouridine synthesizing protein C
MTQKKFLFITRKPPYGAGCAAETLDAALIAAAFDQQVHLAFIDDGVWQLVKGQRPAIDGRGPLAAFDEFADSDIDHVWVERQSLVERGLAEADLLIPVSLIDRPALAEVMAGMDLVISA